MINEAAKPAENTKKEILEDLETDRDEFYSETSKDELIQTLQDEYRKSPKAKWNLLQRLITSGLFTVHHHSGESTPSDSDHVTSAPANQRQLSDQVTADSANHRQRLGTPKNKTVITVNSSNRAENGFNKHDNVPAKLPSKVKFFSGYVQF